jgi:hypothetical protein
VTKVAETIVSTCLPEAKLALRWMKPYADFFGATVSTYGVTFSFDPGEASSTAGGVLLFDTSVTPLPTIVRSVIGGYTVVGGNTVSQ